MSKAFWKKNKVYHCQVAAPLSNLLIQLSAQVAIFPDQVAASLSKEQLMTTQTIRQMIEQFIADTNEAALVNDGLAVVFYDEGETIPLTDLGYNKQYGFYKLSLFPDVENEAKTE